MLTPVLAIITCPCGATAPPGPRLPRGWKRLPSGPTCKRCLAARYLQRAVTIPIAGPVDATWIDFGAALREAWSATTACANWLVTELYVRDVRRQLGETTLAPMPHVYLYPEARAKFPQIAPINLTTILQQVERTYRKQRHELLWTGTRSLAVHRYPVPTPIHQQAWTLEAPDPGNGSMTIRVRLGDRWWRLRLRNGREFAIHSERLTQLRAGVALSGAAALYAIRAHQGDHRHQETKQRGMLKVAGWFQRGNSAACGVQATMSTGRSDLLTLQIPSRPLIALHGDALRQVIRGYTVRRHRGQRPDPIKMANRIKTICQQIAAEAARRLSEAGVSRVNYEDDERGFCDPFPWTKFRLWLQSAIEGQGMSWQSASTPVEQHAAIPLANGGKAIE